MDSISWDIDRVFLNLPYLNFPIYWYGLFFAIGVYLAQKTLQKELSSAFVLSKDKTQNWIFYWIIFIVLGARLGDILFYQDLLPFLKNPFDIFNFRQGGLASHGGVFGFLIGVVLASKRMKIPLLSLLNCMISPAGILGFFIRIGNFFNQEILGTAYQGFGSVFFAHPLDGSPALSRHPVQLYEAITYGALALVFRKKGMNSRMNVGRALSCFFGLRIVLECFKEEQAIHHLPWGLTVGMLLSLPLFCLGLYYCLSTAHIGNARDLNKRI